MSLLLSRERERERQRQREREREREQAIQDWVALQSKGLPLGQAPPQSPGSPELGTQPG